MPTSLRALIHESSVGRLDAPGALADRPRLARVQDQLMQHESVQRKSVQRNGAQPGVQLTNELTAKATGMAKLPAFAGTGTSGVPPRGRPV
jgi:hypothetical protein